MLVKDKLDVVVQFDGLLERRNLVFRDDGVGEGLGDIGFDHVIEKDRSFFRSGFIGVELMPGEHTVTMSFFPSGLAQGILLAVAGIGIVAVFIMMDKKKTFRTAGRTQKKEPVPAG